jgi:hypothetical protein
LCDDREAGALCGLLAHDRSERGAGGIAADHQALGIDPERRRLARDPFGGRDRIVDGGGIFVLGREPVFDRDQPAAGDMRQRGRDAVMSCDAAGDEAAAVKEHEAGRALACACG